MGTALAKHHSPVIIGKLFKLAHGSHLDSVRYLIQCGEALKAVKEAVGYGEWMLWLKDHQKELGFSDRTAQRLIKAASDATLATDLNAENAAAVNRQIWGHQPPPKVDIEEHSKDFRQLMRIVEWMRVNPAWTVNSSLSRDEASEIRRYLSDARDWIVSLESAITKLPGSNGRVIENAQAI